MILNEKKRIEFKKAARPLVKWLCENCHPHVVALIEPGRIELTESVCAILVNDYIPEKKDRSNHR